MAIDLLYFAWVREAVGCGAETVEPPATVETVAGLAEWLKERGPGYVKAFAERDKIRVAVDQEFTDFDAGLMGVKEIAFFPPVTGG